MNSLSPADIPPIEISPRAAFQLKRGNLWVFSNEINMKREIPLPGTWCWFHCQSQSVGTGYFNPHSLIAGRIVSYEKEEDVEKLILNRLEQAFNRRKNLFTKGTARLVFSESDFFPGLIVDWYSGIAVIQSNTAGIDTSLPFLEKTVPPMIEKVLGQKLEALVIRADSPIRRLEDAADFTRIVFGDQNKITNGTFVDEGTHYAANFLEGQKSGFFLDQRRNRKHLMKFLEGTKEKRILDLCSYSGGWGLKILTQGDHHVTFVDESKEALKLVQKGIALNNIPQERTRIVEADVFQFLSSQTEKFDVIVADPPAFVKSKKHLPQAIKGYEKLNRLCWRCLEIGGLLMTCSCSYHLSESEFLNLLHMAVSKEGGLAHIIYRGSQADDHPVLLSMPETNYLKCVGLRKLR